MCTLSRPGRAGEEPQRAKGDVEAERKPVFLERDTPRGSVRDLVILAVFRGDISASLCRRKS